MSEANLTRPRLSPELLPENLPSIQPGGGVCYGLELAWGRLRRWYLKTFRRGYVQRMAERRQGSTQGCPHEILDPRDLKYHRNICRCWWAAEDDPFRWRDKLPFARWGLAELVIMSVTLAAVSIALGMLAWYWALPPLALLALVIYFFRDPSREVPQEPGCLVAPADGRVIEVRRLEYDKFVDGPAVRIGIFLSIFNVHVNRSPARARVISLRYWPGEFLNALRSESSQRNESLWIGMEEEEFPYRRIVVRQIAGLLARRIVCAVAPGEVVQRGERIGMIKLGSRTELVLPVDPDLVVLVKEGDAVKGGSTVLARYPIES